MADLANHTATALLRTLSPVTWWQKPRINLIVHHQRFLGGLKNTHSGRQELIKRAFVSACDVGRVYGQSNREYPK